MILIGSFRARPLYYVMEKETGDRKIIPPFFSTARNEPHGVNPPYPAYWIRTRSFAADVTFVSTYAGCCNRRMATAAAAVLVSTPSFSNRFSRCLLIVRWLMPRMSPMSRLVLPWITQ